MPTCPNGHQSGSDDWCEVCGHRIAGSVPPPPPPSGYGYPPPGSPPPTAAGRPRPSSPAHEPELCPQCRTPREGGAPFCEECRWNFLTNTATTYTPAAPRPIPQPSNPQQSPGPAFGADDSWRVRPPAGPPTGPSGPSGPSGPGPDSYDYQSSRPSQVNRPAEPIPQGPPFGNEPSGAPRPPTFGGNEPSGAPRPPAFGEPSGGARPPAYGSEPSGAPRPPAFGSDPSGAPRPPAFGGEPSGAPRPPAFGDPARPGPGSGFGGDPSRPASDFDREPARPSAFGEPPSSSGPGGAGSGPSGFGGERPGQSGPPGFGEPSRPPGPGFGEDPSRSSGFGGEPPRPSGPSGFGGDPSRQGPPPGTSGGPNGPGAPQGAVGAPPAFPPVSPPSQRPPSEGDFGVGSPPGPAFAADDDWVIKPPTNSAANGSTGGPAGPGRGYGYPQPGSGSPQAPPGPALAADDWQTATWTATIGPDRGYFMAMMQRSGPEAAGLNLPAYSPEQQRTLSGNQVTIGRRRHSTGDTPDIDLAVPPEDPGVSHQHAVLVHQPDGTWAVVDQNSTNGTTVNGSEEPIQPFVPVPLQDGDQVHVGAWTTITVRRG